MLEIITLLAIVFVSGLALFFFVALFPLSLIAVGGLALIWLVLYSIAVGIYRMCTNH